MKRRATLGFSGHIAVTDRILTLWLARLTAPRYLATGLFHDTHSFSGLASGRRYLPRR
jgi:hypothetical protein